MTAGLSTAFLPVLEFGPPGWWKPTGLLFGLVLLAYVGMWRGWHRRAGKHYLPALVPAPDVTESPEPAALPLLEADGRYFGSTVAGDWLDRVVAQGLGARSSCHLVLSADGLDVRRPAGDFRIPAQSVQGARHDQGIAGKVVPPHGLLVVTWAHGDLTLDSGFRLVVDTTATTEVHNQWIAALSNLARKDAA